MAVHSFAVALFYCDGTETVERWHW